CACLLCYFFFSSRRRHTRSKRDWSSDVCSSDLAVETVRAKGNGGSNRTAVKKVLLRAESRLPRGGFFLFCRRADHRGYKNRADKIGRASCRERGWIVDGVVVIQ